MAKDLIVKHFTDITPIILAGYYGGRSGYHPTFTRPIIGRSPYSTPNLCVFIEAVATPSGGRVDTCLSFF